MSLRGLLTRRKQSTKAFFQEGTVFPQHVSLNLVSSRKLLAAKGQTDHTQNLQRESVSLNMQELQKAYADKKRIVMLYQYPAMQFSHLFDVDPLQHLQELERKYIKEETLLLGVSHQHPRFLKQLQVSLNQRLEANDGKMLDVVLCSDHDFQLFKEVRFKPQHEMHVDVATNLVVYNSAQNWRYWTLNIVSVGLFTATLVYAGHLYVEFQLDTADSAK